MSSGITWSGNSNNFKNYYLSVVHLSINHSSSSTSLSRLPASLQPVDPHRCAYLRDCSMHPLAVAVPSTQSPAL